MFQYLPVASIYVWDIRPLTFSRSYYFLDTASVTDFSCISRGRHIMVPLTRFSTLLLHARAQIYPHHSGTYTSRLMEFQRSLSSSSVFRNVYVCSWVQFRFQPTQDLIDSKFCQPSGSLISTRQVSFSWLSQQLTYWRFEIFSQSLRCGPQGFPSDQLFEIFRKLAFRLLSNLLTTLLSGRFCMSFQAI